MYELKKAFYKYFELLFWITAMVALAVTNPSSASHFNLCPLKLMGIGWCPGCGLGHSISFIFRGRFLDSFHAHWLGIPAFIIIFHRILVLLLQFSIFKKP